MTDVEALAPTGDAVVDYDQRNLSLYAALLDAYSAGVDWQIAVEEVMGLEPAHPDAECCWRSHLTRAQWIVGAGMGAALTAFGKRKLPKHD